METRTRAVKPLELNDFMLIQKHEGRGSAIVNRKCLQNTVSTVDLSQCCNDSYELHGVRLEKPDQRHKSLVRVNTSIHPGTASTEVSWDFLEQTEDDFGDTIVMCGDLWKKPWATSSSTQRQLRYQHALDHDKGARTAPLSWLLSPQG